MGNPGDWEYPLIWRFLLSRPVIDTKDVPLFYNLFFSSSENSDRERRWLVQMLTDGTHTSDVSSLGGCLLGVKGRR
jgi:nucleolar pre-ribosomal-associated protein 1